MKVFISIGVLGILFLSFNHKPYINAWETVTPADSLFIDTIYPIVTTSFNPDYGELHVCPNRIRHYFKFIGDSTSFISRFLTTDPQFITNCSAPRMEPLKKNEIYYFDVGFPWHNRLGRARRTVGLQINDKRIYFKMSFNLVEDTCGRNLK